MIAEIVIAIITVVGIGALLLGAGKFFEAVVRSGPSQRGDWMGRLRNEIQVRRPAGWLLLALLSLALLLAFTIISSFMK